MESYSRIRSVKLKRSSPEEPFGFSVRGGHEHGTGIFVSHVEPRSIAHKSRLKVGDQILRLNGFPVSAAVHNECLALMRFRSSLHLKVRSVGMIPVKEKIGDPLTWKLVEEPPLPPVTDDPVISNENNKNRTSRYHGSRSSQASHSRQSGSDSSTHFDARHIEPHLPETKVFIDITGHSGLGCCICKGPPERPGIFVQSTKSNGVAREAGLRPGDQIIQCNGHSFLNVPFAEAVYHLKISKHLNLIVIKGAASDLFPGESSGYNSSASSLNGDMHISASSISSASNTPADINGDDEASHRHGRLAQVSEERRPSSKGSSNSDGDGIPLDRHIEWNEVEETWKEAEKERLVIQIRGDEESTTKTASVISSVRLSDTLEEKRLLEERKKLLEDQRRLLEEAVKFEEEKRQFEAEKRRLAMLKESLIPAAPPVEKLVSENNSADSSISQNSLAGALHKEILKRVERRENGPTGEKPEDERPKPGTVDQKISLFASSADAEKRQQHEQLIKEFKRAHRKMFAHSLEQIETTPDEKDKDPRKTFGAKRVQKEVEHERRLVQQQVAGIVRQRQLRIERQHQECQETEREVGQAKSTFRGGPQSPPPPPPVNGVEVKTTSSSSSKWTTLSIKLPSGPMSSSSDTSKSSEVNSKSGSATTAAVVTTTTNQFSETTKKPISTMSSSTSTTTTVATLQVEREGPPESPSPDYSNSPSPIPSPTGENRWDDRVSANGKIYTRDGPTKFGFPPKSTQHHQSRENRDLHPNGLVQKYQQNNHNHNANRDPPQKNGYAPNGSHNKTTTSVVKTKDGEITTSGNGKVTIILGDPHSFSHSHSQGNNNVTSASVKSNGGGILKMSNGNNNNDHSIGGGMPQKTISFGEF